MSDHNRQRGSTGEMLAARYLERAGYRILERNYQKRFGEIDLIVEKEGCLVFVEVKLRKSSRYGMPSQAVDFKKQQKIIKTAMAYLAQNHGFDREMRFDVIEILTDQDKPRLRHLKGAFRPSI